MSLEASQIVDQMETTTPETVQESIQAAPGTDAQPKEQSQGIETPKDEKVSSRLEVLIKREQAAVQRERAAKLKEAEIEASMKDIHAFRELKSKPDIKAILETFGLSSEQAAQALMESVDNSPDTKIKALESRLEQFQKSQEEAEKRKAEDARKSAEAQEQKAISDFKSEIKTYLTDNKERYELIAFEEQQELVFEVIDEQYRRTLDPESGVGKVMSIQEAADKVEQFLEVKYDKSKGLNKVKALWSAVPKEAIERAVKPEASPLSQKPKTPTLTNNLSATPMSQKRPMSDQEKVQVAIANVLGRRA